LAGDSAQSAVSKPKKVKKQTQAERIDQLEAQVTLLRLELNHVHYEDVKNLFDRTDDFNARLEHFESNSIDPSVPRAKVKLLEYRVGLMRLDVDDLNDRVKVFEEQEDTSEGN